jgi:hypothetical protein
MTTVRAEARRRMLAHGFGAAEGDAGRGGPARALRERTRLERTFADSPPKRKPSSQAVFPARACALSRSEKALQAGGHRFDPGTLHSEKPPHLGGFSFAAREAPAAARGLRERLRERTGGDTS